MMARCLPFDYAFGFAQGKLFPCAALGMTDGESKTRNTNPYDCAQDKYRNTRQARMTKI